jgi:hypothetical protein
VLFLCFTPQKIFLIKLLLFEIRFFSHKLLVRNQFVFISNQTIKMSFFFINLLTKKSTNVNVLNTLSLTNSSLQEMPPRDSKTNFMILRFQMKCNTKEMFSSHHKIVHSSYGLMVAWIFSMIYKIFHKLWPLHRTCIVTYSLVFNVIIALCMCCLHTSLKEENERNKWTWLYLEYIEVMDKFGLSSHVSIRDKQNQFVVLFYFSRTINVLFSLAWLEWQNLLWMLKLQSNT